MLSALLTIALAVGAMTDLPKGEPIDGVPCLANPSQTYVLYLPSAYTPDRAWPVILLFDPGGRGRNAVDRYRAAAEQYGYILAGSNNSRNGRPNSDAVDSMPADVMARLTIDRKRVYTGGMSGGSRVALGVALDGLAGLRASVAGVFASSAGYPDVESHKTLPFAIFATTGTEDFNNLEMRNLDRELTTPHRLAIFEGGHIWPSADLILQAVEWMEIQAMKSRLKPRDDQEIDRILAKRVAAVDAGPDKKGAFLALQDVVADFKGLRDVSAQTRRVSSLGRDPEVREALARERDEEVREEKIVAEVRTEEARLDFSARQRNAALMTLRQIWEQLATAANTLDDSAERRFARRVINVLNVNRNSTDEDYLAIVRELRAGQGLR